MRPRNPRNLNNAVGSDGDPQAIPKEHCSVNHDSSLQVGVVLKAEKKNNSPYYEAMLVCFDHSFPIRVSVGTLTDACFL